MRGTPGTPDWLGAAGANPDLVRFTGRGAEDLKRFQAEVLPPLPRCEAVEPDVGAADGQGIHRLEAPCLAGRKV